MAATKPRPTKAKLTDADRHQRFKENGSSGAASDDPKAFDMAFEAGQTV